MNRLFAKVPVCKLAAAALLTSVALIVTGCGMGISAAPTPTTIPAIGGKALGGNTPIVGATVKLYATTSTGYGVGSFLEEAIPPVGGTGDTDTNGIFNFNANGYTCPNGQFAYITLAGGNTGGGANNNSVLVSALGRCEDIGTHPFTVVNELTTIAAAYALGHFATVSGSGAATVVSIGASAGNNAATGSACVSCGTGGTPVASGLAHAFLNAANLVNVTSGAALTSPPGNSTALVPQQLINSIGNVLVACVNSTGGAATTGASYSFSTPSTPTVTTASTATLSFPSPNSGINGPVTVTYAGTPFSGTIASTTNPVTFVSAFNTAFTGDGFTAAVSGPNVVTVSGAIGASNTLAFTTTLTGPGSDASNCGNIFAATPNTSGVAPTNTFTSMVNLAATSNLGGATASGTFLGYATPATTIYGPALSAATNLNDFSIGIEYPKGSSSSSCTVGTTLATQCLSLTFPQSGALDINDNYYAGNNNGSGTLPTNVFSFSSTGTLLGVTLNNIVLKNALGLAVDAVGNGFFANGTGSTGNDAGKFTYTSSGVTSTAPPTLTLATGQNFGFAVDRANNVWLTSLTGIWEATAAANTTFAIQGTGSTTYVAPSSRGVGFAVDPDQNVWDSPNTTLYILPNSGTAAVPLYSTSGTPNTILSSTTTSNTASAIVFVPGSPYTAYIPGYNTGTNPGVQVFTPTVSTATVTAAGGGSFFTSSAITGSLSGASDGAGNVWAGDSIGKSVTLYNPTAATAYRYAPCVVTGGTSTTCTDFFGTSTKIFSVSVDSAGSVWVPDSGDGNIIEIIGAAAPTWPLLSLGLTGKP